MQINRSVVWGGLLGSMLMLASAQIEPRGENPAIRVNTFYGSTGLITVPTSTTTRVERLQLGTAFGHGAHTVSLNWGVYEGIEIGGTVVDRVGMDNKVIATGKVAILPQNFEWLELGFGAIDPFDAIQRSFYGIASANVRVPTEEEDNAIRLRLHLGYGTGMFREKLIGGAELFLDKRFSTVVEYNGVDTNAALRYVHDDSLRLQLGLQAKVIYFSATYGMSF